MRTAHSNPIAPACAALLLAFSLLGSALAGYAQGRMNDKKGDDLESLLQEKMQTQAPQTAGAAAMALESSVNPEHYYVGPSDLLSVNVWMSPPLNFSLTVTPEGTLIIPTVGEIRVADLTLAEAKRLIVKEIRRKYLVPEITATLLRPRPIIVSVIGAVMNPGLYTMTAMDRANKLIDEANKLSKLQSPWELAELKRVMSTRNILVRSHDGRERRVDLPKYAATHEDTCSPYLREGDVVVVPQKDPLRNVLAVYGQVNAPGRFEFVPGDRLLDAVRIAQGPTVNALTEKAIFSRQTPDGLALTTKTVDLRAVMAGTEENFALEPGDRIVLQGRPEYREDSNVDVAGEVRFPATYPITKERTRLSEVIRQAGGITSDADLSMATVVRHTYLPADLVNEAMISQRGIVSSQDTIGYALENSLRMTREAVPVDFVRLFEKGDSTQDIFLKGEDEVMIPRRQQTIYVFGQVAEPGHISFAEGKGVEYYIQKAGGFSDRASRSEVKIVKARTKQWIPPGDTKLEAGDYIWIPADADRPFSYYMTVASQAASVLSVVIGVGVLILQISK